MDSLHLTDCERELYAELFASLDPENEGRISVSTAFKLITDCELTVDVIEKVIELCGAKRLGHFGRSQFYIALKLIACAQNGLPLNADALANTNNIPLPVFSSCKESKKCETRRTATQNHSKDHQINNKIINCQRMNSESCHLPPPPPTKGNRQRHATAKSIEYSLSPVQNPAISSKSLLKDNCEVDFLNDDSSSNSSSEAIHSPKCEAALQRNNWNSRKEVASNWEYCDEEHRLLGNDEDSELAHSSNDEEENSDIWSISKEQKEYYLKQFKALETDAEGKLSGRSAKEFFEKSKLPQSILSKIWKLSDIDKDGALTSDEFCTAMHLVVLRRNNVEIPDSLPSSSKQIVDQGFQNNLRERVEWEIEEGTPNADIPDSNALSPQNKQWTKFTDSPTNIIISSPPNSSTSSSAGIMQPANFDFNAASIERDPKILHPVALRVSPDGQRVPYVSTDAFAATIPSDVYATGGVTGVHSNYCTPRKEPPPPPPPRPLRHRGHTRSSSLDLNRLGKAQVTTELVEHQRLNVNISPRLPSTTEYRGAFTIYRKTEPAFAANNWLQVLKLKYPLPALVPTFNESDDPIDLMRTIRSLQQRNFYLESIYCDLIQELANALETNSALETKIKQLVASK